LFFDFSTPWKNVIDSKGSIDPAVVLDLFYPIDDDIPVEN
jgi:hypothetical protein